MQNFRAGIIGLGFIGGADQVSGDCRGDQFKDPGGWGTIRLERGLMATVDAADYAGVPGSITLNGTLSHIRTNRNEVRIEQTCRRQFIPESLFRVILKILVTLLALRMIFNATVGAGKPLLPGSEAMAFTFSEKHITNYHTLGYTIFREILPTTLVGDLRRVTDRARILARAEKGRQTQRLQPIGAYDLDLQPFKDYGELPELNNAIHRVLTPRHYHADLNRMGVLLEPADHAWCTNWHRDWRDHMPKEVFESEFREDWDRQIFDVDYMNQVNCALYEDPST